MWKFNKKVVVECVRSLAYIVGYLRMYCVLQKAYHSEWEPCSSVILVLYSLLEESTSLVHPVRVLTNAIDFGCYIVL